MNIIYGKSLTELEINTIQEISNQCDILFDTARLLYYRNINTVQKAKKYLNPSKKHFYNPLLLKNMQLVVDRINTAKNKNQHIVIFGDYDADGVCALSILYYCLKDFGITPTLIIPEREEGYGLNYNKIIDLHFQKKIDLLLTVDCGVSDFNVVQMLMQDGIDVIVTDHHEIPDVLPDCPIINPKLSDQEYPFDGLCGAGVAYKVGYALIGEKANDYLDFVALATVADTMDLIDENRDIVVEGLKLFSDKKIRYPFMCLLNNNDKSVTASTLAFAIAPKINAGGRMGDANASLKLFTTQNNEEAFELAVKLSNYNLSRQADSESIFYQAKELIQSTKQYKNSIICVKGEGWNLGVLGIVSAKLVEEYKKPVIVFSNFEDYYKGSARSINSVNIYDLLYACKGYLKAFGGHSQAAGVSVCKENFDSFYTALLDEYNSKHTTIDVGERVYADWEITNELSLDFAREITLLEPFGEGNKKPTFITKICSANATTLRENSPHVQFKTQGFSMLYFNGEPELQLLNLPIDKYILFDVNYSVFRDVPSFKGFVKRVFADYSNLKNLSPFVFSEFLKNISISPNNDNYNYSSINSGSVKIEKGYGTIYAIQDINNLSYYENKDNIDISFFEPKDKNGENCIVVCPNKIYNCYDSIIYLDKIDFVGFSELKISICQNILPFKEITNLSVKRDDFSSVFNYLSQLVGKKFINSANAYLTFNPPFEQHFFIFATEVFLELGFFFAQDGVLNRNYQSKSPLTNSKIYSKINSIKGIVC